MYGWSLLALAWGVSRDFMPRLEPPTWRGQLTSLMTFTLCLSPPSIFLLRWFFHNCSRLSLSEFSDCPCLSCLSFLLQPFSLFPPSFRVYAFSITVMIARWHRNRPIWCACTSNSPGCAPALHSPLVASTPPPFLSQKPNCHITWPYRNPKFWR